MKSKATHPTSPHRQRAATAPGEDRLGQLLVREGLISQEQLDEALRLQLSIHGQRPLGQILVDQRVLTAKQLNHLLQLFDKRPRLGEILVKTSPWPKMSWSGCGRGAPTWKSSFGCSPIEVCTSSGSCPQAGCWGPGRLRARTSNEDRFAIRR